MDGVTAGASHTCAWNAKSIYCWGDNSAGQLGTKSGSSKVPALVPGIP